MKTALGIDKNDDGITSQAALTTVASKKNSEVKANNSYKSVSEQPSLVKNINSPNLGVSSINQLNNLNTLDKHSPPPSTVRSLQ